MMFLKACFMARIWYSVAGEGMGHAVRSHSVIEYLKKDHDLLITAYGKAFSFLKEKYGSVVHEIQGNFIFYEDNAVLRAKTFGEFVKNFPFRAKANIFVVSRLLKDFKPDLLISDFEPASHYFSFFLKIPSISLDNLQVLSECKMPLPRHLEKSIVLIKPYLRFLNLRSDYFLLPVFCDAKPLNPDRTKLSKPIVRRKVMSLKPSRKGFVLVYQTSPTNEKMLKIFSQSNREFRVYGMGRRVDKKNVFFKEFNESSFLSDLKNSEYVIVNGGFTVISEALYLGKPIISIPVKKQFEQEFNAFCVEKQGFGIATNNFLLESLELFESNLERYYKNLSSFKGWRDDDFKAKLNSLIQRCLKKPQPRYVLVEKLVR